MGKVKIELNSSGIMQLLKSQEVQGAIEKAGETVAGAATSLSGQEYATRVHVADYVAICNVYPNSKEAAHDNYENNTLLKAVGAVGLPQSKSEL